MDRKSRVVGVTAVISSLLLPTIVQAGIPFTRQTQENITMYDNGENIRAFSRSFAGKTDGLSSIDSLSKELTTSTGLRTTKSRVQCELPVNEYCENPFNPHCELPSKKQDVFPSQKYAKQWVGSCFTPRTVFDIEADLATAMEANEATRSFYHFTDVVKVRNLNAPDNYEEREVYYNIILDKNTYPGNGIKSGVTLSDSEYTTDLYVVYRNTNTVDLIDDVIDTPNAGEMIVYTMSGNTPENSNLEEIDRFKNTAFDTTRLSPPTANFRYETDGVKNALNYIRELRDSYNSDIVVFDYENPISIKECPAGNDGKCLPSNHSEEEPTFKPKLNIFTTDRTFYRNVCTGEGVSYEQTNTIQAEIESYVERYVITKDSNIPNNMSNEDLLALDRIAPLEFDGSEVIEEDFNGVHSYAYDTNIDFFDTRITDYLGRNSSAPDNTFSPVCSGSSSFNNEDCYEWNGLHHDHYKKPIPEVEDISIVDVFYEEKVQTAPATTEIDSDGNEVEVPAVFEWKEKNTCNTTGGTRTYNISDFCDQDNIDCKSVDRM